MRAFIAINPPSAVRDRIAAACRNIDTDGAFRWVPAVNIHLTLRFLGETTGQTIERVAALLDRIASRTRPFDLALSAAGWFPPRGAPRVLWIGCEPAAPLELLQHDIECGLVPLGFDLNGAPFRPHFTVARVRDRAPRSAVQRVVQSFGEIDLAGTFAVASVELMRSEVGPEGSRYDIVASVPLGGR